MSLYVPCYRPYNKHNTNIHAPGGIRTHDPSKRAATGIGASATLLTGKEFVLYTGWLGGCAGVRAGVMSQDAQTVIRQRTATVQGSTDHDGPEGEQRYT
jgi:hypothetical protein